MLMSSLARPENDMILNLCVCVCVLLPRRGRVCEARCLFGRSLCEH